MDFFKYQGLKGGPFQIYGISGFVFAVFFRNTRGPVAARAIRIFIYCGRRSFELRSASQSYSAAVPRDTMAAEVDCSDDDLQLELDDIFGGPVLDDDPKDVRPAGISENRDPNVQLCRSGKARSRLPWVSVGIYEGETCTADAEASLKTHAQEPWYEPKGRKSRQVSREGIPLTQTPRRLADGTVVSEFRCPFSQVRPYGHHPHTTYRRFLKCRA